MNVKDPNKMVFKVVHGGDVFVELEDDEDEWNLYYDYEDDTFNMTNFNMSSFTDDIDDIPHLYDLSEEELFQQMTVLNCAGFPLDKLAKIQYIVVNGLYNAYEMVIDLNE